MAPREDDTKVTPVMPLPEHGDAPEPLDAPEQVGRYRIGRQLGEGGMGVVYAAHDPELDREVALKLLRLDRDEPGAGARMLREGQALARLTHPNVVTVYDVGVAEDSGGQVFIAMELVVGQTLASWTDTPRTWQEILDVYEAAAEGLAAAHAAGLVHRDFKPANVMIGDDGRVRVMDFGLARVSGPDTSASAGSRSTDQAQSGSSSSIRSADAQLTRAGFVIGTPGYMAPEQHRGETIEPRTDQFAFCAALYRALFGVAPFAGATLNELYDAKLEGVLQPPIAGRRAPPWLMGVVRRGLAPRASERWPSLGAMLEATAAGKRRRARGWTATIAVTMVGIGAGTMMLRSQPASIVRCDEAGAELDEVWNQSRAEAVAASLASSSRGYAESTATRVRERVDTYASTWRQRRIELCEQTQSDATDPLADAALACLRSRQATLRGTVQRLEQLGDEDLDGAVRIAAEMPAVEDCADPDVLAAALPAPEGPQARQEVDAIRAAIAGRDVDMEAAPTERYAGLRERAAASGYEPVVVEVLLADGRTRSGEDRIEVITEAYERAIAARHDAVAAESAALLAHELAYNAGKVDEAQPWASSALAAMQRIHDVRVKIAVLGAVANVRTVGGAHEEADALYVRAIRECEQRFGENDPGLVNLLSARGDNMRREGKLIEALPLMERARDIATNEMGEVHPKAAEVLGNLGVVHRLLGNLDTAKELLGHATTSMEKAYGPDHPRVGMALGNYATVFWNLGDMEQYEALTRRAIPIFENSVGLDHPITAMAKDNLAQALASRGELQEALVLLRESLRIREAAFGSAHEETARSYTGLGSVLRDMGRPEEGLPLMRRGIEILIAATGPEHPNLANMRLTEGLTLLALDRPRDARATLDAAMQVCDKQPPPGTACPEARWELARTLRMLSLEPVRAERLARDARDDLEEAGESEKVASIDAWLAAG